MDSVAVEEFRTNSGFEASRGILLESRSLAFYVSIVLGTIGSVLNSDGRVGGGKGSGRIVVG